MVKNSKHKENISNNINIHTPTTWALWNGYILLYLICIFLKLCVRDIDASFIPLLYPFVPSKVICFEFRAYFYTFTKYGFICKNVNIILNVVEILSMANCPYPSTAFYFSLSIMFVHMAK